MNAAVLAPQPAPSSEPRLANNLRHGFDPITLEIIRHDLVSIPNQIDKNITRTAFSPLINEYKDYAVGIVDAEGRLISQSRGSLLIFVANALGTAVRDGIALHGAQTLVDGDVLISNHAGTLGQHLNNVVMYTPIRVGAERRLAGFFCVLMHWIDVGGSMVGSCTSTTTTEIFQEGIQFRSVRLFRAGERLPDMFRMIEYNTRFPDMLMGDVEAQIAGCFMGRDMVAAIADKHGLPTLEAAVHAMWDDAEAASRAAIRAAKPGVYEAFAFLDNDGLNLDKTCGSGTSASRSIFRACPSNCRARSLRAATAARWRPRASPSNTCSRPMIRSTKAISAASMSRSPTANSCRRGRTHRSAGRAT